MRTDLSGQLLWWKNGSACLLAMQGVTDLRDAPNLLLRVLALVELLVGLVVVEGVLIELSCARLFGGRQAGELVADLVKSGRVGASCVTLGGLRNVLGKLLEAIPVRAAKTDGDLGHSKVASRETGEEGVAAAGRRAATTGRPRATAAGASRRATTGANLLGELIGLLEDALLELLKTKSLVSATAPARNPTEERKRLATYSFNVRLHLLVGEATKLGLEIPEVVNGTATVRGSDNILGGLSQLLGHGRPGSLYGSDRVDKSAIHL
jgi:hypothetical protein